MSVLDEIIEEMTKNMSKEEIEQMRIRVKNILDGNDKESGIFQI